IRGLDVNLNASSVCISGWRPASLAAAFSSTCCAASVPTLNRTMRKPLSSGGGSGDRLIGRGGGWCSGQRRILEQSSFIAILADCCFWQRFVTLELDLLSPRSPGGIIGSHNDGE